MFYSMKIMHADRIERLIKNSMWVIFALQLIPTILCASVLGLTSKLFNFSITLIELTSSVAYVLVGTVVLLWRPIDRFSFLLFEFQWLRSFNYTRYPRSTSFLFPPLGVISSTDRSMLLWVICTLCTIVIFNVHASV